MDSRTTQGQKRHHWSAPIGSQFRGDVSPGTEMATWSPINKAVNLKMRKEMPRTRQVRFTMRKKKGMKLPHRQIKTQKGVKKGTDGRCQNLIGIRPMEGKLLKPG